LYGVKQGLWIAQRRVPVRIQVLAPNQRPVQVTENLATFWKETYPKLNWNYSGNILDMSGAEGLCFCACRSVGCSVL